MNCAGCKESVNDSNSIKCTSDVCDKDFCMLCTNVSSLSVTRRKLWKCPDCSAVHRRGGDNSLTPARPGPDNVTARKKSDSTESEMNQLSAAQKSGRDNSLTTARPGSENVTVRKKSESTESEVHQLTEQLRQLTKEFSSVKTKLDDLTESLSFTNEKMNEIMHKLAANEERLKYLEKRDVVVENLQVTVLQLKNELKAQAQVNLRNEIEIVGIPENSSENLHHTVLVAAKKMGVELEDRDLDWVSRVGPRRPPVTVTLPEDGARMPRPVVVRLLRRSKRDQFLKATKSRRTLTTN
ncbi:Uncharacterized protein OBRU01_13511 [Operophtera brumata]|uniref:Zinc finger DNA binding protein n=1 Tax=Operophtera brumata TaxID=104452 RepID=A0A0L7L8I5_OPEBR|nr:Uncharacterized protein OBRU01_13511 [Operophtera brumata]